MATLFDKRREYVNKRFGDITRGRNISNPKKTKLLRKLWRDAKRKIK